MSKLDGPSARNSSETADGDALPAPSTSAEGSKPSLWLRTRATLSQNVLPAESHWPLFIYCLATGWVDAITYTSVRTWSAFQTGNTIQLSISLAETFSGRYAPTHGLDLQNGFALASLLCAATIQIAGATKIIDTKGWHFGATLFCALLTFASSMLLVNASEHNQGDAADENGNLAWHGVRGVAILGLLAASMGLQGTIAKRLNTSFATTVVLTSVWIDLVANPNVIQPKRIRSRDQRVYAILALFVGGFGGRAILGGIGASAALGIGAGIRALGALLWLTVPSAPPK